MNCFPDRALCPRNAASKNEIYKPALLLARWVLFYAYSVNTPTPRLVEEEPTSKSNFAPNSIAIMSPPPHRHGGWAATRGAVFIKTCPKVADGVYANPLFFEIGNPQGMLHAIVEV